MTIRAAMALAVVALLAGCADEAPAAETPADQPSLPFAPDTAAPGSSALRFASDDYESTVQYEESFATPQPPCVYGATSCAAVERRIDLTSQVPAQAPVELAASFMSSVCVDLDLEVEGATIHQMSTEFNGPLAASLVREAAGTVTLLLRNCSFFSSDALAGDAPVDIEVRTVVRPDVVPAYVPLAIRLTVGDHLSAIGDDLEALVVVPPAGSPMHLDDAALNVTPALGAGTYIVVALGRGDMRLHGPNVTLRALPVHIEEGERRPIPSGTALTWDFSVPGVPLFAGITVRAQDGLVSPPVVEGDGQWTLAQRTVVLLEHTDSGFTSGVPNVGLHVWRSAYAAYLDERMTQAPFTASVTYTTASGLDAYHVAGWVEP